jgi:hypothetical protein
VGKELSFHYPARSEANGAGSAESTKSRAGTARLFTLSDGRSRWAVPTLPGWAAMHRAKGLEFKVVIVMGCDEDMLPRASVLDEMVDEADRAGVRRTGAAIALCGVYPRQGKAVFNV